MTLDAPLRNEDDTPFRPRRAASPSRSEPITWRSLTFTPPRHAKSEALEVPQLALPERLDAEASEEMSRCETIFNLANTMVGSGVLAVPYAFRLTSYWAVALLLLVVALTAFTACLIGDALKLSAGGRGRDFIHLAEVAYGQRGKYLVAMTTSLELWVAVVTFLVMSGSNLQGLLGAPERHAVLLCTLLSAVMIFVPLRVYAYVSLASLASLLVASVCFLTDLAMKPEWSFPEPREPKVGDLFRAYGLFIFCFAGHPCFPALHENMRQAKQWTGCVALSFCIAALYYVLLGLSAFLVLGDDVRPVFTKDVRGGWLRRITVAFFAVKIQLTTPVLLRVVLVSMQIWPDARGPWRRQAALTAVVVFLTGASACFLAQKLAALASLAGSLLVNLTSVVIPALIYMRLATFSKSDQVLQWFLGSLVVFGLLTAAVGTYLAMLDMG